MSLQVHEYAAARRKRPWNRRTFPVQTTHVHPDVMAEALAQAAGNPSRLFILSPTKVAVRNRPRGGVR